MANASVFLFFIWLSAISRVKAFQYSDLQALNASCSQRDSCKSEKDSRNLLPLNWKERNCFCDDLCDYYGDCCLDASTYDSAEQRWQRRPQGCVSLRNYGGVYMRQKCASDWQGDARIVQQCKAATPRSEDHRPDPILGLPVTSQTTKLTYSNYYCALCNNDVASLTMWYPRVECPSLLRSALEHIVNSSNVFQKLTYENDSWGVYIDEAGISTRHLCTVDPFLPETVVEEVRSCKELIASCPEESEQEESDLCDSYTALVYDGSTPYRNYHCAMCNNVSADNLSCFDYQLKTRFNFNKDEFNSAAFSLLFDFTDKQGGLSVGFSCGPAEIWDPFFEKCRNVVCADQRAAYINGKCEELPDVESPNSNGPTYVINETGKDTTTNESQNIILFPDEIVTLGPSDSSDGLSNTGYEKHLNCNRILLPHEEFTVSEDGSIVISKYQKTLTRSEYELHDDGVLVCLIASNFGKFSSLMSWITLTGLGISFICLVLHLVAFFIVGELRNLSGKNLASLCVALLSAYVCFILGIFGEEGKTECVVLAALMYYFFLASFFWMNVMAFDVWRALRLATNELRVTAGKQWAKFSLYCLYAWLTPGVAVAVVLAIDMQPPGAFPPSFLPGLGQRLCWFGGRKALLVFFAAPLSLIMVLNISFFILAAKMIAGTAQSTARFSSCQASQQGNFKLYLRLALLMGLSWISGIMAGYLQEETLWYVFIVLNTFQGAFIFAAFTCKKNVFDALCCALVLPRRSSRPASSEGRNLESRDSNNSQVSHCSVEQLTPQGDTTSTSISL